jgi:hypothetical protein
MLLRALALCTLALPLLAGGCGGSAERADGGDGGLAGDGAAPDGAGAADGRAGDAGDGGGGDGGTVDHFRFLVFGDLNGGGCDRNAEFSRVVAQMAAEPDVAFVVATGDLIDGYVEGDGTLCFAATPGESCAGSAPAGNLATILAPIKDRTPAAGLPTALFPTLGNHDDNWGDDWYPDPCGGGICGLLSPLTPDAFINHAHGDLCSLTSSGSYGADFYYSFSYGGSRFIVLRQDDDYEGMLSCNNHGDCPAWCADPANFADPSRADDCYDVAQFDWLRNELATAAGSARHIFVFVHAVMLGSGDNHGMNAAAPQLRALFEAADVDLVVNGHNHAYERTLAVRGSAADPTGTTYVTVGPAGALTDGADGDWFTAATYEKWTTYGDPDGNSGYLRVTVDGGTVLVERLSLAGGTTAVDGVTITR